MTRSKRNILGLLALLVVVLAIGCVGAMVQAPIARASTNEASLWVDASGAADGVPWVPMSGYQGKTVWAQLTYYNLLGDRLFAFRVTKYFEYNGRRVNNWKVSVSAPTYGLGWEYVGLINSSTVNQYRTWNSNSYGSHYSAREGKFVLKEYGITIQTKTPWIAITVRGDGSWSYSTQG